VAGASTCAVSVGLGCALGAAGVAGSVAQYSDGLERLNTGFVSTEGQHVLDSFRPGTHPGDVSLGSRFGGYVVSSAAELVLERVGGKAIGAAVHAVDGKRGGGRVGSDVPKGAATAEKVPQIALNRQNGAEFERQVVDAFSHVGGAKNTTPVTVPLSNGMQVTTIPDMWGKSVGGMLEVKNVQNLSMSNQLRAQIEHAGEIGQPLNLVVSPGTRSVSRPLQETVRATGGDIYRYNPATGDLTKFVP